MNHVRVTVIAIHPHFGNATAQDDSGQLYLINRGTEGMDFNLLQEGTVVEGDVDERNYMVRGSFQ